MKLDASAGRLAAFAGLGTWAIIGIPILLDLVSEPSRLLEARTLAWLYAYLSFGAVFALAETDKVGRLAPVWERIILAYQSLMAALTLLLLPQYGFSAILFIITAVQAAHIFSLRAGFAWVLGQTLFIALVLGGTFTDLVVAGVQTLAFFGFQLFALVTAHSALRESEARAALGRANAELRATQQLLADSSRAAERTRISRELHDLIGHHLTALSLNLEVAGHVTDGKAKEHVDKAHTIAKLLLSDVRDVVGTLRDTQTLDLEAALTPLIRDVPRPKIHLSVPDDLEIDDVERGQAIVRCVQEIVTNTIRHADAENLWIDLVKSGGDLEVRARDDGRGSRAPRAGHGLEGMRERLEALGGTLTFHSMPGKGFNVSARLPKAVS